MKRIRSIGLLSLSVITVVFLGMGMNPRTSNAEELVLLKSLSAPFESRLGDNVPRFLPASNDESSDSKWIHPINFESAKDYCSSCDPSGSSCGACEPAWAVVAPYVWMPAMKGQIGANGSVQNVDLTLSELFDLLPDLNGALMGHVEVGKDRRGLIIDGVFMKFEPAERGPLGGTVDVEADVTILEMLGMYRLLDQESGQSTFPNVKFDLLGGLRYYHVGGGITINPIILPSFTVEQSESWVDLVLGARTSVSFTDQLDGFVKADFGGFGMGTSSELAWNFEAGVKYDCRMCSDSSLLLGYRVLDIDQVKNGGTPEQFVFDMKLHGPFAAWMFEF